MAQPSKDIIFTTLNQTRHRITEEQDLFSTTNNDAEYWLYTDLYNLFLHPMFDPENMYEHTRDTFDTTPAARQKITPYELFKNHTIIYNHKYTIHSPHPPYNQITKMGMDIKLSRYTCYCIFKNKPNLIFTRTYFMMPDADFKTIYDTSYRFARIYQREILRKSERDLAGVLNKLNANIPLFHHEMARTFYAGYTMEEIREAHNITKPTPLADNMGAISLHARRHAIDNAIRKFDFAHKQDFRSFSMILHNELLVARNNMISTYKLSPEKDIYKTTITQIESEYNKLEKQFMQQYAQANLNTR